MKSNTKAFTLVELLVVIAVIALLLSILMPALNQAREMGKTSACLSNLKQLGYAWVIYAEANDGKIVSGLTFNYPPSWEPYMPNYHDPPWVYYVDRNDTTKTYQDRVDGLKRGALYKYASNVKAYKCQSATKSEERSYAIVTPLNGEYLNITPKELWPKLMITKISQLQRAGERMTFSCLGWAAHGTWFTPYAAELWWNQPTARHSKGSTFSFADGHSEYFKWKDRRTVEFANLPFDEVDGRTFPRYSVGNPDLHWVQKAVWGKLYYEP